MRCLIVGVESEKSERREVIYRGRVQGVGFRYTTQRVAQAFSVSGYVKNLPDGRVLVEVEGQPAELDRFLAAVADRLGHYISDANTIVGAPANCFPGFEIRF